MAALSMEDEIKALKEELARLKQEDTLNNKEEFEEDMSLDSLVDGAYALEGDLELKAHEIAERMKEDYENMSPITAVAIFAVGALFGRLFLSK